MFEAGKCQVVFFEEIRTYSNAKNTTDIGLHDDLCYFLHGGSGYDFLNFKLLGAGRKSS